MSGTSNIADTIRILQQAENGGGPGALNGSLPASARAAAGKIDPKTVAFQTEMRMAQRALHVGLMEGDPAQEQNGGQGFETAMVNDAMMMDALSTIARLTGQEMPGQGAAQAGPQKIDNALTRNPQTTGMGSIAAMFESGEKGIAAIGFDRTGGTSYGKFQISSRAGTMNRFLNFLAEREPAMADRLRRSGPANTGSTQGRMPAEWAKIAAESPERFEKLQTEFITKDHYQPAREKILEQTGVDIESARPALREALFSTAVQHGASGAARIFNQAIDKFLGKPGAKGLGSGLAAAGKGLEQALVSEVYDKRQHQFGGSTQAVQASVRGRLKHEKDMILALLDKQNVSRVV
jgi:hypothetical protein